MPRVGGALIVLVVLTLTAGCTAPPAQPPNVLLITIDTLRADRVGRAGLTPTLDAVSARGTRFTRAYAHAPTTLASHASMLTGLRPPSHGVRNNGAFRLADSATTLAEVLKAAGYATGAFVSAFVLDGRYGLSQGFDVYDDRLPASSRAAPGSAFRFTERRAPDTLGPAASWISQQQGRWFAWVHLFDPHAPYAAPGELAARGYDGEVAYIDASLATFLAGLGATVDRTLVIVTADHGESLGEHGESTHGLFAYDATLRVPLIVAGPGVEARVAPEPVSHVDIMPTVLELTGTQAAGEGQSLVHALKGFALPERPIYFEAMDAALTRGWAPLSGVIDDGWKYIDLPLPELYDLSADAAEHSNRIDHDSARASRLRELTSRMRAGAAHAPSATALADDDARARLRALGYASGGPATAADWREENDPKRLLPLHARFQKGADLAVHDREAAIREMRSLIDERPDFSAAYEAAATLLMESGRPRDAAAVLSAARARGLRHRALVERLGAALLASGDARGAITTLEPAATMEPEALDVRYTLALAYISAGDYARARETLTTIVRLDPTAVDAWTNLGTLDLQRGAMREAQQAFERALEVDDSVVPALKGLGAALEASDPARAAMLWDRALTLAPSDHALLARLAFLLAKSDIARAKPYLERLIQQAPEAQFAAEKGVARRLLQP
jgi:arylsulfatase A-like enzyme